MLESHADEEVGLSSAARRHRLRPEGFERLYRFLRQRGRKTAKAARGRDVVVVVVVVVVVAFAMTNTAVAAVVVDDTLNNYC